MAFITIKGAKLIGGKAVERALVKAFEQWAKNDINEDHWSYQFLEREWDYDYDEPTIRENRGRYPSPITSPRNIEDWGDLYESGVESYSFLAQKGKALASWEWNAKNRSGKEYAWYVHEGLGTNRTARPFTDDIAIPSSFWRKEPGQALKLQVETELSRLNAK